MDLEFYYDIVCPYAYIASRRVEALAARTGATLVWKPVLLGGIFQAHQAPQHPGEAMVAPKARLNVLDIDRYAALYGVPLSAPEGHPRRTVDAMRLILAAPEAVRPALSHDLFRAYWVEGRDVTEREVLAEIGGRHGVSGDVLDRPEVKQALFDAGDEAVSKGVFGVPTFVVGEALWWGQDRMHLVEASLNARRAEAGEAPKLMLFHDFASPFSYLGSAQAARVARQRGVQLELRPFLLGALFREVGTPNVPLMAMHPAKRSHAGQDILRWARWWGVELNWPSTFPLRTVAPLRVAIQAPELTAALYRAAWVEDRDIGDPEVLAAVITEAGGDAEALLAGCQEPAIKARLKANTEEAARLGACGAPTWVVVPTTGAPEVFWGQDRVDVVEAALDRHLAAGLTT